MALKKQSVISTAPSSRHPRSADEVEEALCFCTAIIWLVNEVALCHHFQEILSSKRCLGWCWSLGKDFAAAVLRAESIVLCSACASEVSPRKMIVQALPVLLEWINYTWSLLVNKARGFLSTSVEGLISISTLQLLRTCKLGDMAVLWWLLLAKKTLWALYFWWVSEGRI